MRYTIEEIRQMPEGQTFDCKSIHIEPKALANTIVAMANAYGGMIAVGISDKAHILSQIQKTIDYLETQVKEHSCLGEDGLFKTDREYPKFAIQEMTVNSVCHRDYSIKGTEILIKMFDDRLVFEPLGKQPGIVRTDNIRHTHFSRNPKIAEYLKAFDYVKEFGEGVDRMCRELSAIGT